VAVTTTAEEETHGYGSLLTVVTHTREGRKIIAGTVFFGQPRIVRLRPDKPVSEIDTLDRVKELYERSRARADSS